MKRMIPMLLASSVVGLSGCGGGSGSTETTTGGGGGGGSVTGLDMPVTLSVVTAKETSGSARQVHALKMNYAAVIAAFNSTGTDYSNAEQHKWIHDDALEPLSNVNEILCYVGQTGADQLVNKTYVALIDGEKCQRSGGGGGQNQSSGGGKTTQLEKWIVKTERADNSSPQYVKIWAAEEGDGVHEPKRAIRAEVSVTEGVSDTNPYGKFVLNFAAVATEDFTMSGGGGGGGGGMSMTISKGDLLESGTLKTVAAANGKIGFSLYQKGKGGMEERKVSVVADADQSAGVAFTGGKDRDMPDGKAYAVAFNSNNILVLRGATFAELDNINSVGEGSTIGSSEPAACLSRSEFKHNVWRYGLFNQADGSNVAMNSGFPFRWDSDNDAKNDSYGYASYWGVWSEKTPDSWDGKTITKEQFGSNAAVKTYTLKETPGKLVKSERQTVALTELDGQTFQYWECGMSGCAQYKVEYDSNNVLSDATTVSGPGFFEVATVVFSNGQQTETPMTPTKVDTTAHQWLNMYSQGLGGQVSYDSVSDPTHVAFFKETTVDGADSIFTNASSLTLNCFTRCLKPDLTATQYADQSYPSSAYYPDSSDVNTPAAVYSFDKSNLALKVVTPAGDADKVVRLAESFPPVSYSGPIPWGVNTNSMVLDGVTLNNVWDTWNQSVTFRWETGHNSWNKVIAVLDGTTPVTFDKPLAFSYKHLTANDANGASTYNGKTFLLNYGGNGDLWGIPWVDPVSGKECTGGGMECRPAFALKDGVSMGSSNQYVVKGLDMELKPAAAPGNCSTLVLNKPASPLPSAVDGTPSNMSTDAPTPGSEAPAIIGGELQK